MNANKNLTVAAAVFALGLTVLAVVVIAANSAGFFSTLMQGGGVLQAGQMPRVPTEFAFPMLAVAGAGLVYLCVERTADPDDETNE